MWMEVVRADAWQIQGGNDMVDAVVLAYCTFLVRYEDGDGQGLEPEI